MAGRESSGVKRDGTFYGRSQTIPTTYSDSDFLEGIESTWKHTDPDNPSSVLSQRTIRAFLMRNQITGTTVTKGLAVTHQDSYRGRRFDGYSSVLGEEIAGVIDDHLNSGGCRFGDLCWIQTEGPCDCRFRGATTLAIGDLCISSTTSGKFDKWDGTGTTTENTDGTMIKKLANVWGRAMEAASAAATTVQVDLQV